MSQTVYLQGQTEESVEDRQRVPAFVNFKKIDKLDVPYAQTILARDYKGFGTSNETSTGILEHK